MTNVSKKKKKKESFCQNRSVAIGAFNPMVWGVSFLLAGMGQSSWCQQWMRWYWDICFLPHFPVPKLDGSVCVFSTYSLFSSFGFCSNQTLSVTAGCGFEFSTSHSRTCSGHGRKALGSRNMAEGGRSRLHLLDELHCCWIAVRFPYAFPAARHKPLAAVRPLWIPGISGCWELGFV